MKMHKTAEIILAELDKVYPDNMIKMGMAGKKIGDGLAEFIVTEVKEVTHGEPTMEAALDSAKRALLMAVKELTACVDKIDEMTNGAGTPRRGGTRKS